jgi:lipopolysaccharide transport protein LptA
MKLPPEKATLTFALCFLLMSLSTLAHSQTEKKSNDLKKSKEPIEVVSEKMRSENKGEKIIFSGNVFTKWGDLEIKSDTLEVFNPKGSEGGTDQIIATGNVFITRGLKKAKGDKAVYLDKEQKIILTGKIKATAWEDTDVIEGKEMIFLLEQDKFQVNDEVKMKFFPKDKDEKTDKSTSDKKNASRKK